MGTILPAPETYAEFVPERGSPVWSHASDMRLFGVAGYALVLQVAHPTVGAGVAEHSNFQEDPWGRLHRTLDYVNGTIYGGPALAGDIGRRVREMHKTIKGVRPDGERYHALEPRAYAWVHATLASAIVDGHARFGRPMDDVTAERFWRDWLNLGRLIGVRDGDLPAQWRDFRAYFDDVVARDLVDNPTVHVVLDTMLRPAAPPLMPQALWKILRWPAGRVGHLLTVGMLPAALRAKLGLSWSPARERAFRVLAAVNRAMTPLLPPPARVFGPVYLRLRRKQIARGDVARRSEPAGDLQAAA